MKFHLKYQTAIQNSNERVGGSLNILEVSGIFSTTAEPKGKCVNEGEHFENSENKILL